MTFLQFFGKKFTFTLEKERARLLACMGISLLIWTGLKLSGQFETTRHVHLKYAVPPMMEFSENPPGKLTATVSGSGLSLIRNFVRNPHPTVTFDLRENAGRAIDRGEILATAREALGLHVTHLDLNFLSLKMDSMLHKKVPVRLVEEVKFAPDFFPTTEYALSPDSALISGPPEQLANITEVFTEKLSAENVTSFMARKVKLELPPEFFLQINPTKATVTVEATQFTEKRFVLPIEKISRPDSTQFIPAEVEVTCLVPLGRFTDLKKSDLRARADMSGALVPGSQNIVPVVISEKPDWVRSVELVPPTAEYFIIQ